jgi:type II secretory pathway pseudopilin PulG
MAGFWRTEQLDSLECGNRVHEQSGFSMVEAIVAMLLVAVAISGLVPLYSYIHENLIKNIAETLAYNLAEQRIEAVKAADYVSTHLSGMGTFTCTVANGNIVYGDTPVNGNIVDGNPPGQFNRFIQQTYGATGNIVYTVTTQVNWNQDYSRSSNPNDTNNGTKSDYKDVIVEVKATNGAMTYADITLATRVTYEAGEEASGTNIIVVAYKAWGANLPGAQTDPPYGWGNVGITVQGPATYQVFTNPTYGDLPGQAIFPIATQDAGTYTIITTDGDRLMVLPGPGVYGNNQITTLQAGNTNTLSVEVEYPCYLKLYFKDLISGGSPSITGGQVTLIPPGWSSQYCGIANQSYAYTAAPPWNWPYNIWPSGAAQGYWTGSYNLTATGITSAPGTCPYNDYTLSSSDWDGQFDNFDGDSLSGVSFNGTQSVTVAPVLQLTPSPAVEVVDGHDNPVTNATVTATPETWNGTAWNPAGTPVSPSSQNGNLYYFQNSLPASPPGNCYFITVTDSNGTETNSAFWIDGGSNGCPRQINPSTGAHQSGFAYPFVATD